MKHLNNDPEPHFHRPRTAASSRRASFCKFSGAFPLDLASTVRLIMLIISLHNDSLPSAVTASNPTLQPAMSFWAARCADCGLTTTQDSPGWGPPWDLPTTLAEACSSWCLAQGCNFHFFQTLFACITTSLKASRASTGHSGHNRQRISGPAEP